MVSEARVMVHVRLSKPLVREIDHLAVDWDTYRNEAVERLLTWAIENYKSGANLMQDQPISPVGVR